MELHFLRHNYEQATDDKQHKFQQIFTHFSDQKSQMQVNVSVFFFCTDSESALVFSRAHRCQTPDLELGSDPPHNFIWPTKANQVCQLP